MTKSKQLKIPPKIERVEQIISEASGVTIEQIHGTSRETEIIIARQSVWFVAHYHLGYNYSLLGRIYQRDHTTIRHGVEQVGKSKVGTKVVNGIRKIDKNALSRLEMNRASTVDSWKFDGVENIVEK